MSTGPAEYPTGFAGGDEWLECETRFQKASSAAWRLGAARCKTGDQHGTIHRSGGSSRNSINA